MANTASLASQSNGTFTVSLTSLGDEDYLTFDSSGNKIRKTGGGTLIDAESWEWSTDSAHYVGGVGGGFGNSSITTTDATPTDITSKTTAPYVQDNFQDGWKCYLSLAAGTQTVEFNIGVYGDANMYPIEVEVKDAGGTTRLNTTLSYSTVATSTDINFTLDINSDSAEAWVVNVKKASTNNAYSTYIALRYIHLGVASGGGPTIVDLEVATVNVTKQSLQLKQRSVLNTKTINVTRNSITLKQRIVTTLANLSITPKTIALTRRLELTRANFTFTPLDINVVNIAATIITLTTAIFAMNTYTLALTSIFNLTRAQANITASAVALIQRVNLAVSSLSLEGLAQTVAQLISLSTASINNTTQSVQLRLNAELTVAQLNFIGYAIDITGGIPILAPIYRRLNMAKAHLMLKQRKY